MGAKKRIPWSAWVSSPAPVSRHCLPGYTGVEGPVQDSILLRKGGPSLQYVSVPNTEGTQVSIILGNDKKGPTIMTSSGSPNPASWSYEKMGGPHAQLCSRAGEPGDWSLPGFQAASFLEVPNS